MPPKQSKAAASKRRRDEQEPVGVTEDEEPKLKRGAPADYVHQTEQQQQYSDAEFAYILERWRAPAPKPLAISTCGTPATGLYGCVLAAAACVNTDGEENLLNRQRSHFALHKPLPPMVQSVSAFLRSPFAVLREHEVFVPDPRPQAVPLPAQRFAIPERFSVRPTGARGGAPAWMMSADVTYAWYLFNPMLTLSSANSCPMCRVVLAYPCAVVSAVTNSGLSKQALHCLHVHCAMKCFVINQHNPVQQIEGYNNYSDAERAYIDRALGADPVTTCWGTVTKEPIDTIGLCIPQSFALQFAPMLLRAGGLVDASLHPRYGSISGNHFRFVDRSAKECLCTLLGLPVDEFGNSSFNGKYSSVAVSVGLRMPKETSSSQPAVEYIPHITATRTLVLPFLSDEDAKEVFALQLDAPVFSSQNTSTDPAAKKKAPLVVPKDDFVLAIGGDGEALFHPVFPKEEERFEDERQRLPRLDRAVKKDRGIGIMLTLDVRRDVYSCMDAVLGRRAAGGIRTGPYRYRFIGETRVRKILQWLGVKDEDVGPLKFDSLEQVKDFEASTGKMFPFVTTHENVVQLKRYASDVLGPLPPDLTPRQEALAKSPFCFEQWLTPTDFESVSLAELDELMALHGVAAGAGASQKDRVRKLKDVARKNPLGTIETRKWIYKRVASGIFGGIQCKQLPWDQEGVIDDSQRRHNGTIWFGLGRALRHPDIRQTADFYNY